MERLKPKYNYVYETSTKDDKSKKPAAQLSTFHLQFSLSLIFKANDTKHNVVQHLLLNNC